MPNNDHEPPKEMNGKTIEKFFGVEEKRIEVETVRENNISKELEMSAESSRQAFEISKLDVKIKDKWVDNRFKFRNRIAIFAFIFILLFVFIITGIIFYFGRDNIVVVEKVFTFLKDAAKFIGGGLIGFFVALARSRRPQPPEE